jgi:hypothetical protein
MTRTVNAARFSACVRLLLACLPAAGCGGPSKGQDPTPTAATSPATLQSTSAHGATPALAPQAPQRSAQDAACERLCATALRLKCEGDDMTQCTDRCLSGFHAESCHMEVEAFLSCAASRPTHDWECDPDTGASVRDGVCEEQQATVMQCLARAGA